MSQDRLRDQLAQMRQAAADACDFVVGMDKPDFIADLRTQRAVIMSLVIVGESAVKIMDQHPEFTSAHPAIPWRNIRGMRNRIAHGYFEVNLDIVWDTVSVALPDLLAHLPSVDAL